MYNDIRVPWPGWEIARLIGRGSFGSVYEIRRQVHHHTETAALKIIRIPQDKSEISELRSDGYDDESITNFYLDSLTRIEEEYSTMADLKGHTNIVYCDDFVSLPHENSFGWDIYIKMELLTPLKCYLDAGISENQVIQLGSDICNALIACKEHSIVHRDIKPENIFVSRDGRFKLGDFGIAKTMEETVGGTRIGTYEYMAPEVYNNQAYHSEADIYSLGLVMYWLLNDRLPPFLQKRSQRPTLTQKAEARRRRFSGEALPAPQCGSPGLQAIVLKACAFEPKQRYTSAKEMLGALQRLGRMASIAQGAQKEEILPTQPMWAEQDETVGVWSVEIDAPYETVCNDRTEGPVFVAPEKPVKKRSRIALWLAAAAAVVVVATVGTLMYLKPWEAHQQLAKEETLPAQEVIAEPDLKEPVAEAPGQEEPEEQTPQVAVVAEGACGSSTSWSLTELGTLTISGSGDMGSWRACDALTTTEDFRSSYDIKPDDLINTVCTVVVENGVTIISKEAFQYCQELTDVTLADSISKIGTSAFYKCSSLERIEIPGNVTEIGKSAFNLCSSLIKIVIPDGVSVIEPYTFYGCEKLSSVTLPSNVITIGGYAFCYAGLTEISLPSSVQTIGEKAFASCCSLRGIAIPDGISVIEPYTFYGCEKLSLVTLPSSVITIGDCAFSNTKLGEVRLPSSVQAIGKKAFASCISLREITLSDSLQTIGESAFASCVSLKSIVIPDGVSAIEPCTFYKCKKLLRVTLPNSVQTIGEEAFASCSIKTIEIPAATTEIDQSTFDCQTLEAIHVDPDNQTFYDVDGLLYVDSVDAGKTLFFVPPALKSVNIGEGTQKIAAYALSRCKNLESISIPTSVNFIGSKVFPLLDEFAIYYGGTWEEWKKILIVSDTELLLNMRATLYTK